MEERIIGWLEAGDRSLEAPSRAAWSQALAPLAEALVPADPSELPEVSTWALHGRLQQIPLAALPVADGWLSDLTVVAVSPSLVARASVPEAAGSGPRRTGLSPVLVVDPERNLRGSQRLARGWSRGLEGLLLAGDDATVASFESALPTARWLHLGAHIDYDSDFPELSRLRLADGDLLWLELFERELELQFANLSACDSGRWPATADSGSYGLAGFMARRGSRWVIASRFPLANQAANDFNATFYDALIAGAEFSDAYALAHRRLRASSSPTTWATLLLIEGSGSG